MTLAFPFLFALFFGYVFFIRIKQSYNNLWFLLLKYILSLGLGIGVLSNLSFWFLFFGRQIEDFPKVILRIGLVVVSILLLISISFDLKACKNCKISFLKIDLISLILFIAVFVIFIDRLWINISSNPNGFWDATAIWNLHARFLYFGKENWQNLFSPELVWSHNEYPLLTPGFIYFCWVLLSSATYLIPLIISVLFTVGLIGLLFISVSYFRGISLGSFAAILFMLPMATAYEGASQYADIPLAFYFLATLIIYVLIEAKFKGDYYLQFLLGVFLGFCVFTKNEGWSFVLSFVGINLVVAFFDKDKSILKWFVFVGSFLLSSAAAIGIKILAPSNDLLGNRNVFDLLNKIMDGERYKLIFSQLFSEIKTFSNGWFSVFLILLALVLVIGIRKHRQNKLLIILTGTILLTFMQYLLIYIITPNDLAWHLSSSMTRLIVQLYPSLIFIIFYFVNNPFDNNRILDFQTASEEDDRENAELDKKHQYQPERCRENK